MAANVTDFSLRQEISTGVRSLFYAIPPSESSFKEMHEIPKYVEKATPYFISAILLECLIHLINGRKDLLMRWNDAFSSLSAGVISLLPLFVLRNIEVTAYIYLYDHYRLYALPWDSWWTWILCALGTDLGYYWVHRMAHEINFMWAGHQVHHSSEDYNLNTALRQSVLQRYSSWIFYLPMAFFIPPSIFMVHIQFNLLYQFWIHTNTVGKLGPLEWVLNTASHHRVHHGRNRYCIDKNYAGVLIIWDRMFGTFVEEKDDEPIAYGLVHPINSWDPLYTQLCHWQYMFKTAWNMPGFWNKLSVFLKGPGWEPGKPRLGNLEDIPDIRAPQPKYDRGLSALMAIYAWTHFALTLACSHFLGRHKEMLESSNVLYLTLFMLWTLTNIGYIYENKWYAPLVELIRCITYLAVDSHFCGSSACPDMLKIPRVIFYISAALWLVKCLKLPFMHDSETHQKKE